MKYRVYCDGGLIADSPSTIGGTYTTVVTTEDYGGEWHGVGYVPISSVVYAKGIVVDESTGPEMSCNYIETYAICEGVNLLAFLEFHEIVQPATSIEIYSDSVNGMNWATAKDYIGDYLKYISLYEKIQLCTSELARFKEKDVIRQMVKGHPRPSDYIRGHYLNSKGRRKEISAIQDFCHAACSMLSNYIQRGAEVETSVEMTRQLLRDQLKDAMKWERDRWSIGPKQ